MKNNNTKRITFLTLMILILVVSLAACAPKTTGNNVTPTPTLAPTSTVTATPAQEKTFTLAELAKYDGLNGNKAYIAVDGIVYNVTDHPKWKLGKHFGFKAGKDHTKTILTSPHGKSKLSEVSKVGILK